MGEQHISLEISRGSRFRDQDYSSLANENISEYDIVVHSILLPGIA
jgi:hypothetical protein